MERRPDAEQRQRSGTRSGTVVDARTSLALWLRAGRAQRGMSLGDVARVTKIQPRILERLESGKADGLPADVFVRGFVRSFARCVGLDEGEALERYRACTGEAPALDKAPAAARAVVEAMADLAPATARTPRVLREPAAELAADSANDLQSVADAIDDALAVSPAHPAISVDEPAPTGGEPIPASPAHPAIPVDEPVPTGAPIPASPAHPAIPVDEPVPTSAPIPVMPASASTATAVEPAPAAASAAASAQPSGGRSKKKKRRRRARGTTPPKGSARAALATGTPAGATPVVSAPACEPMATPSPIEPVLDAAIDSTLQASEPARVITPDADEACDVVTMTFTRPEAPASADTASTAELAGAEAVPGTWQPRMPPLPTTPSVPWRRPYTVSTAPTVVAVIDDEDPDSAERALEDRQGRETRRSFLPPILLDREDRSARQGGLTLAVILLLIAATLTLSYLMRRPSSSGDGVTQAPLAPTAIVS